MTFLSRGYQVYFDTSDDPLAFFRPVDAYRKCKMAEAIVGTYFLPVRN